MEFLHRASGHPARIALFPGTFNPITVAHRALTQQALAHVDEVILVLPRQFPHKTYSDASFEDRVEMLSAVARGLDRVSVAVAEKWLFLDIAAECHALCGPDVSLAFLCGRDAAERIANWDYGRPGVFPEMLRQFNLLVAARQGEYEPPEPLRASVLKLDLGETYEPVSASAVRARLASGEPWEHLVPPEVQELVRRIYQSK
jgi:nicotinate (nicotinamide) nucleotide adenylyltransferase